MKTPRRKSKSQDIDQQTSSIPVGEAKALFDAVSNDNTKTISLGVPTKVIREAPVRSLGEKEASDGGSEHQYKPLPEGVVETLLDQDKDPSEAVVLPGEVSEIPTSGIDIDQIVDRAFEAAGLPVDTTTDQLVNQAVEQMNAEGIDFDALLEQGTAMMEQLIAGIDPSGPAIPGTIEMDIEQDDGSIKHCVFDNPDRPYHMAAMAQCDALIQQYDQQRLEQATKPAVKPLRVGWFSWL